METPSKKSIPSSVEGKDVSVSIVTPETDHSSFRCNDEAESRPRKRSCRSLLKPTNLQAVTPCSDFHLTSEIIEGPKPKRFRRNTCRNILKATGTAETKNTLQRKANTPELTGESSVSSIDYVGYSTPDEHVPSTTSTSMSISKSKLEALQSNVKKVYSIVSSKTGSIGGNGHGGAIYGETTTVSMQKMIDLMKQYTGLDEKSRFIDVGSGLGKPNLHVAQDPGVEFSYGIEMEEVRWMLGMHNLRYVLEEAKLQRETDRGATEPKDLIGYNCIFEHGDITQARTFDPFTHVYMFDIGFPPKLFRKLSEMFNNSRSPYLICYHGPKLIVGRYNFQVELLAQVVTSMHGSSENHTGYIYQRKGNKRIVHIKIESVDIPCDPLFKHPWEHVGRGLNYMSALVDDRLSSFLYSGRPKRSRAKHHGTKSFT